MAAPELIAVALQPIVLRFRPIGFVVAGLLDVKTRRFINPGRWKELLALPLAFLQQPLAKLGQAFGLNAEPPSAGVNPSRTGFPFHAVNAEWLKQTRRQVIEHRLPRDLLHDGAAHVGGRAVVHELRSWLMSDVLREEGAHPMRLFDDGLRRFLLVARGHGEQILHPHRREILADR